MNKYLAFYYGFIGLGFLFGSAYLFLVRKKYDISKKESVLFALTGLCASLFGAILMAFLYNELILFASGGAIFAASRLRLFGILLFSPFIIKGIHAIGKQNADIPLDLHAVGTAIALGFAKIGCFFYGCCYGIAVEHGIVNRLTGQTAFPVQLTEAACCFVLATVLICLAHKGKCKGLLFPIAQIAYSVPRFFLEFLRHYDYAVEGDIFLHLSVWQWFAVLTTLIGILWLAVARRKRA